MKVVAISACVAAVMSLGLAGASATAVSDESVVPGADGRVFGPEHGAETEEGEFVHEEGNEGDVSVMATFRKNWGTSYVESRHPNWFVYNGKGKAAANVINGKRIIRVCFRYERNGKNLATECSNATQNSRGEWIAGPEVRASVRDSLQGGGKNRTKFKYWTSRIDPRVR